MPGGDRNIKGTDGNTFSADNQPAYNPGRPRKLFSSIIAEFKAQGYERATAQTVMDVYEYLLALPLSEVIAIAGQPKDDTNGAPVLLRIAASELIGRRRAEILEKMLDRAHGKATSKQELSGPGGKDLVNPLLSLTPEKQIEVIKIINSQNAD